MISPSKVRAARALLNWSQTELAERADLGLSTVQFYEAEKRVPELESLEKLTGAFKAESVFFTESGVEQRNTAIYDIAGDDWWVRVLDDAHYSLLASADKECLLLFADDRASPPSVNEKIRAMRKDGVRMRQIVQEGNRYLMGAVPEYKWVPREYFQNHVTLIYADKIAVCAENNTKAVIFKDEQLAATWRNLFNLLWCEKTLMNPDRSDAHERF